MRNRSLSLKKMLVSAGLIGAVAVPTAGAPAAMAADTNSGSPAGAVTREAPSHDAGWRFRHHGFGHHKFFRHHGFRHFGFRHHGFRHFRHFGFRHHGFRHHGFRHWGW
jgi:hypothetical protein